MRKLANWDWTHSEHSRRNSKCWLVSIRRDSREELADRSASADVKEGKISSNRVWNTALINFQQ